MTANQEENLQMAIACKLGLPVGNVGIKIVPGTGAYKGMSDLVAQIIIASGTISDDRIEAILENYTR